MPSRLLATICLTASAALGADPLPAPPADPPETLVRYARGSDRAVELLAGVLLEADPAARERATRDLGATANPSALAPVRLAMGDADARVRAAAIQAAADLGAAGELLAPGLTDKDPAIVLTALGVIERNPRAGAPHAAAVHKLLSHESPAVRRAALDSLTLALHATAAVEDLRRLMDDADLFVRMAAMRNLLAAPASAPLTGLVPAIRVVAVDASAALAAMGIEALGRFDAAASRAAIADAAANANPLLRRGACRACRHAGDAAAVVKSLADPSPMVRLAAIEAVGELKATGGEDRLFALMTLARQEGGFRTPMESDESRLRPPPPPGSAHYAALAALEAVGSPRVSELALEYLASHGAALADAEHKTEAQRLATRGLTPEAADAIAQTRRNVAACCRLLAAGKNKQAVEPIAQLLRWLAEYREGVTAVNAINVAHLAGALGAIGDERGVTALREAFRAVLRQAGPYLAEMAKDMPAPVTFGHQGAAAIIRALGQLHATAAADDVLALLEKSPSGLYLAPECVEGLSVLADLAAAGPARPRLEQLTLTVLSAPDPTRVSPLRVIPCRYAAARLAARLQMAGAVPALRRQLARPELGRPYVHCVAWALQALTGQAPALPPPLAETGDWIVRPL